MPGSFKARPKELRRPLLTNPHKGCATFQRFNGDPLNEGERWSEEGPLSFPRAECEVAEHYLPSTVSYCRWFWPVFQPEEDRFDWSAVEGALRTAHERGQTLQVRLMPHGSHNQPEPPRWYQEKHPVRTGTKKTKPYVEPVYDGREYLDAWGRVVTEFGRRFDGHPDLESVDVSFIGPWGEGAGECSDENIDRMTALYREAHPKTHLLAMISGYKMKAAVRAGAGWRCDCFGDLKTKGNRYVPDHLAWNHTYDCYPMEVARAGAADVWKTSPVVYETCGVPLSWKNRGYDLSFIMQQGYKFHGSVLMPKSCPIPDEYMGPLSEFCDRIGYRFVLRQARWPETVRRGETVSFEMWVENTGAAPIYRDYKLALRIKGDAGEAVIPTSPDLRTWLPGDAWIEEEVRIPETLGGGGAMLSAGIVAPETNEPKVRFAVEETDGEGWVPLGAVAVE